MSDKELLEAAKAVVEDAESLLMPSAGKPIIVCSSTIDALRQAVQNAEAYTPLTKEEIFKLADSWLENNNPSQIGWATTLERAVIERLGRRWPK